MTCRTCRARKVKCDKRPNGCVNCERLGLPCLDVDGVLPTSDAGAQGPPGLAHGGNKRRTYRSCGNCRSTKTKCNGEKPECSRCKLRSIQCVYGANSEPFWTSSLSKQGSPRRPERAQTSPQTRVLAEITAAEQEPLTSTPRARTSQPPESQGHDPIHSLLESQPSTKPPSFRSLSWLTSSSLPSEPELLRELVEQYFKNIHPLRSFAFVHKPSFMQSLDHGSARDSDEEALLHIICAHGAKFYALEYLNHGISSSAQLIHRAGNEWAKVAEGMVLKNYGKICMNNLMSAVLLYDYQFRLGNYAQALVISGLTTRMAHALQLNLEHCSNGDNAEKLWTYKESKRRLMWACYVLDTWTGSGVDQLTLLHESDIKVQLPSREHNFLLEIPTDTTKLENWVLNSDVKKKNTGLISYYIHLVSLWKRVARYVKHLDTSQPPWLPESEFCILRRELRAWRGGLPSNMDFSPRSVYIRLESSQLGALAILHATYHNAMCDLYRISMPELFKLQNAFAFPPEQSDFLKSLQIESLHHAQDMAMVLAETGKHGSRFLADSLLPSFCYNGSRVILYYIARILDPTHLNAKEQIEEAIGWVESNNRVLRDLSVMIPLAEPLYITSERWLQKVRHSFVQADSTAHIAPPDPSNVDVTEWSSNADEAHNTPDSVLNPLSIYRLARKTIRETYTSSWLNKSESTGKSTVTSPSGRPRTWSEDPARPIRWLHSTTPQHSGSLAPAAFPVGMANPTELTPGAEGILDLDDLQYFLSWGMEGIGDIG